MPNIDSLQTLLTNDLRDLLDAENRLTKALPKLAKAASNEELRTALEEHLGQTEEHVNRVEQALSALGAPVKAKTCHGIKGIIDEGNEHLQEDFDDESLKDATVIGGAQKAEHYEIASYGTAIAYAKLLGLNEVINLLVPNLEEEKAADEKLTQIAESIVNPGASEDEGNGGMRAVGNGGARRSSGSSRSRGGSTTGRSRNGSTSRSRSGAKRTAAMSRMTVAGRRRS
jgi:ferritin-like metal-binding protein YciE